MRTQAACFSGLPSKASVLVKKTLKSFKHHQCQQVGGPQTHDLLQDGFTQPSPGYPTSVTHLSADPGHSWLLEDGVRRGI